VEQILVISCAFSLASISNCLANFEVMFNPSLKGLRKELLTMFFFGLDALLRALTFSAAIFAHPMGWLLVLLAYLVRSAALFAIIQTRGFIYAPGEEDPRVIALAKHVGFSLVPAGLIQVVSDYPFNDLLAMSTSRICGLHVLSTWVEPAAATAALILGIDAWEQVENHGRLRRALLGLMLTVALAKSAMFACFYAPSKQHLRSTVVTPGSNANNSSNEPARVSAEGVLESPSQNSPRVYVESGNADSEGSCFFSLPEASIKPDS
jgi:hypothetical protein